MRLEGQVIVITGGAQGLGLSMAKATGGKGARIALVDMNQDSLDAAVSELNEAGVEARGYTLDITDEQGVVDVFGRIVADFGAINGLINNAGITRDALLIKRKDDVLEKLPIERWQAVIDTNLTGSFLCGREAAAKMIELDCEGVIINISSISNAGNYGQTNYSAAKAGVAAMAVTWAKELARYNIRCAAIAPGFIATEMTASMRAETLEKIAEGIPVKRLGQPDEISQAAISIFENDYYTGRVMEVDGGLRL